VKLFLDSITFFSDFFHLPQVGAAASADVVFASHSFSSSTLPRPARVLLRFFMFFFSSSFSSFHFNGNHLNIIVILLQRQRFPHRYCRQRFHPSYTCTPKQSKQASEASTTTSAIHITQNGWIFFLARFCSLERAQLSCLPMELRLAVEEFMFGKEAQNL